jgi:hypothetical protein
MISVTSPDSNNSREATPEFNLIASYEARTPLHWDAEEWDYNTRSEDDEPLTDDGDLQILLHGDLDEDDDEDSWDDNFLSFSEENAKEDSCMADRRLREATVTPTVTPAMMAATAAAPAAVTAAATTTPACPLRTSAARP